MVIFTKIVSSARSSLKGVARDVLVKVVVAIAAAGILAIFPSIRDWVWNTGKAPVTIAFAWVPLIAIVSFIAGLIGSYLMVRKALKLGRMDAMTDTYRADQIDQFLEKKLGEASGTTGQFAVLLVDIDNFKAINDHYNHEIGNHTLAAVAKIVRPRSPGEEIFRYGGDEFLIVSKLGMEMRESWGYAKRIVRDVAEFDFLGEVNSNQPIKLTVSCGCTLARADDSTSSIRSRIVEALKAAKTPTETNPSGKNTAYFVEVEPKTESENS